MIKLLTTYYSLSIGVEPKEEDYKTTLCTAEYLKDNNYSDKEILAILRTVGKEKISGEDLPDILWETSLLNKNTFYYSDLFHIKSNPPSWNPVTYKEECENFYLEMRINFSIDDLLNYYYDKCRIMPCFKEDEKNKGALRYLINKYSILPAPGIDYVIAMINKASEDDKQIASNVFEIEDYNKEVIEYYQILTNEAELEKSNKIVWRTQ